MRKQRLIDRVLPVSKEEETLIIVTTEYLGLSGAFQMAYHRYMFTATIVN